MIQQGQTIGIIGGGQLGQMMALDAKKTGMKVIVLDPTPACPAGQVADDQIVAPTPTSRRSRNWPGVRMF